MLRRLTPLLDRESRCDNIVIFTYPKDCLFGCVHIFVKCGRVFFLEKDVKVIDVTRSCMYMMALTGRNKRIGTKKESYQIMLDTRSGT